MKRSFDETTATTPPSSSSSNNEDDTKQVDQQQQQQNKKLRITNSVNFSATSQLETSVGITEYITPRSTIPPFFGLLKHKVADFLVNEVDMDGNVVHLTEKKIPDHMKMQAKVLSTEEKLENEHEGMRLIQSEKLIEREEKLRELEQFLSNFSDSEQQILEKLNQSQLNSAETDEQQKPTFTIADIPSMVLDAESDKQKRARTHEIIRNYFGHVLISDVTTVPSTSATGTGTGSGSGSGSGTCVRLRYQYTSERLKHLLLNNANNSRDAKKNKKKGGGGRRNKNKDTGADNAGGGGGGSGSLFDPRCVAWPRDRPHFLQFVLYKENCDTTNAMSTIAKHIRVKPNLFTWAGTKDKRGVTAQLVTAFKLTPEKLSGINNVPSSGVQVGNYKFVNHRLLLGQLKGNRFELAIRKLVSSENNDPVDDASILNAVKTIGETGFINYFGMQRFGMSQNPTHLLGQYVLKNDWENVVTKLLRSRCAHNHRLKQIIDQFFVDRDANAALQKLSVTNSAIEKALMTGYAKSTVNDHSSAFGKLPRNLKTMFIHAYQSYVWNHMVSARVRTYGFKPIVGDLVLPRSSMADSSDAAEAADDFNEVANLEEITAEEETTTATTASTGTGDAEEQATAEATTTASSSKKSSGRVEPKIVTEQDLDQYTIFDVVMTVPGGSVIYPSHEFGEDAYYEFMGKDGIEREHFSRYQEEYGSYGAYRHMIAKAHDVTWKIVHHDNFDQKLLVTDAERMRNFKLKDEEQSTGKFTSLLIGFTLPSSTYATMFMRELMKLPSVRDGEEGQQNQF